MRKLSSYLFRFLLLAGLLISTQENLKAYASHLKEINLSDSETETTTEPYRSSFFRVAGTPVLTVHTTHGNIEIVKNPELDGVQVDLYVTRSFSLWSGTRSLDDFRILIHQQGNQIIASVEDRRTGTRKSDVKFDFVIQVPANASTNLRSVNGNISIRDVDGPHFLQNQIGDLLVQNVNGDVRALSTQGHVEFTGVKGKLFAKTVTGNIYTYQNFGEIRLRTVSGDVISEKTTGTLILATTSGNIIADFDDVSEGIYMETVSGNIELDIPRGRGYDIRSQAMRFDFSGIEQSTISKLEQSYRQSTLTLGQGGHPVQLSTVSGHIKISDSE